ncbi:putative MPP superfamily phosphohydrolase [Rhizobium mesoamericanum]|uniref:metallophosphoesterase n=1 Tax=Rhizobium mesoamericanum TaxID=1079800 RepID=UPI00278B2925|nr:metallophosphoesterase [Rhizobium mesoamericanum]MDQ0564138.1 putative MPP superfamily phosphohydrolase [Rhizobium mesoamericanum]
MFHLVLGLPWLVVVIRFIQPLPWIWPAKAMLAGVLLIASQHLVFNRISSGSIFAPEYPRPLIVAFNFLFGATVLLAVFQIALDVLSLIPLLLNGHFPVVPPMVRYVMGTAAILLAAIGVAQAVRIPSLKNVDIAIKDLPEAFDGYRLLQLTDLHLSRLFPVSWAEAVVKKANELKTDLIVVTGDFIDGHLENRRADVAPLAQLQAPDGIFAIPGNHEYYFGYDDWIAYDASLGMRMLTNEHAVIERGGDRIVIAGVTDLAAFGRTMPNPDLTAALNGAPAEAPVILLDHQPRMAAETAKRGISLQLSGHTHGGMVVGLDRLVARANGGFVSGLYEVGDMQLYVNNGTGLWPGFALRLGRPSELTVFTLRRRS